MPTAQYAPAVLCELVGLREEVAQLRRSPSAGAEIADLRTQVGDLKMQVADEIRPVARAVSSVKRGE